MSVGFDFNTPPFESIAYLEGKSPELHFDYDEIMHAAHHKAFTVAKITRLDLLSDIHESLITAQKNGQSFKAWKENIKPTLKQKGWWGETTVTNPKTGEVKEIYVGSRRLKTIYDTNMRVSYAQGRYRSQMQSEGEYLRYSAVLDQDTRPKHAAMHGTVLPKDHPWWEQNYPPNGWHCRCKAQVLSKYDLKRRGLKVHTGAVERIADKDWAYHPGKRDVLEEAYAAKVAALDCKETNAKKRSVPCGFVDAVKAAYTKDMKTLAERAALYTAVKALFTTDKKENVELCKSSIFGKEKRVLLSSDTVQSHLNRTEIGAFEYSIVPLMLKGKAFRQKENTYVLIKKLGKYYRVALKNVKSTDEIYVVNLIRANKQDDFDKWIKELDKFEKIDKR